MNGNDAIDGGKRRDPAWKHSSEIEISNMNGNKSYKYLKCNYCSMEVKGGVKRLKDHLAHTRNNVKPCPNVPEEVKKEMIDYMKAFKKSKHAAQHNMQEMIDCGSYFPGSTSNGGTNTQLEIMTTCNNNGLRGVRGPMDRYMVNNVDGDGNDTKLSPVAAKEHRNMVCLDIGRFFFENGIPFNCAKSPSFANMCRSLGNYGRGFKVPSMYEMRSWILDEEVKTTESIVNEIKETWKRTGVTIVSDDGWSDMRNRSLINFLVNNPHGTVFLRSVDASSFVKDAPKLFEMLEEIVEEVGEDLVIQVVTDNASAYKAAGKLLMEKRKKLYWTPCAAHCIDLMLEKIGDLPQHKNALLKAKRVANFIYNHLWVLSLTRKYAKKDLVRPAATRFATAFLTLDSMLGMKQSLQMMFVSRDWSGCAWAKKDEGKDVKKIIMSEAFWEAVVYSINTTKPLVYVLRLVDGEIPAMGFIYGAMDEAKEQIAKNLNNDLQSYKEIWDIIDAKWEKQMHRDLHAAGYYLNPRYRYSPNVSEHPEIKIGLWSCMEKILADTELYLKVDAQIRQFKNKEGLFGSISASSYMETPPADWWEYVGDEVPELRSFAIKILSLTCSSSACERNWSTFNQVHTKRRNRLSTVRLNKLVYIMYNKKLKHKHLKKRSRKEGDDPLIIEDVHSDDEWIAYPTDEEVEDEAETNESSNHHDQSSTLTRKRKKNDQASTSNKGKQPQVQGLVDEDEFDEELEHEHEREPEEEDGVAYLQI